MSSLAPVHAVEIPADDPHLVYEGRVATASGAVRLGFPGTTLRFRAQAAAIQLRVHSTTDDACFDVRVDEGTPRFVRLKKGESTVHLVPPGPAATHSVEVIRRTESWQGVCEIRALEIASGRLLNPPTRPNRRLLFIGDSVTCGQGADHAAGPTAQSPERSKASDAYGMLLARRMHAQCHLVSYGGRGIIRDWQGIRATHNAPQFYELTLPDDPSSPWDHSRYVPDAIGICLGTNDFSQGIPDQNEFVNAYVEFVRKVRRDAPHAFIFVIDSPILNDAPGEAPKRSASAAYLDEVVRKVGSARVRRAAIRHYPGAPDDAHPTGADHRGIADELEPMFRSAMGW